MVGCVLDFETTGNRLVLGEWVGVLCACVFIRRVWMGAATCGFRLWIIAFPRDVSNAL
jgi:hypothetical protein